MRQSTLLTIHYLYNFNLQQCADHQPFFHVIAELSMRYLSVGLIEKKERSKIPIIVYETFWYAIGCWWICNWVLFKCYFKIYHTSRTLHSFISSIVHSLTCSFAGLAHICPASRQPQEMSRSLIVLCISVFFFRLLFIFAFLLKMPYKSTARAYTTWQDGLFHST